MGSHTVTKKVETAVTVRDVDLVVTGLVHLYPGYRNFEVEVLGAVLDVPKGESTSAVSVDDWTRDELEHVEEELFQWAIR